MNVFEMKCIAKIHSDFPTKFGIPRQSGVVLNLHAEIVFEPEYRNPNAVRGLEGFSHIWILWYFSEVSMNTWTPTVRPPRLGGNRRMGVFSTRSPFRPNPIGLSCARLDEIEYRKNMGSILHVSGADLMDGTPILDIKPYLSYADSHPDASGGFADQVLGYHLKVKIPQHLMEVIPEEKRETLVEVLAQDPRPSYQTNPERIYGMQFAGFEIKFQIKDDSVYVCSIESL